MEFSRPECWSGEPFPSSGDLPNPGTEPRSPTLQADSLPAEPQLQKIARIAKTILKKKKKNEIEDTHFPFSKLNIDLQ